jgi:hypothetical protein
MDVNKKNIMDVNKIIILYIILLILFTYQEHEVVDDDDDEDELHFLQDLFDFFSSHGLQSKDLLEEQEHEVDVEHDDDEHDHPDDVEQEWLVLWCFFCNLAQLAPN